MAKRSKRRQVGGETPKGERITVKGVSSNGCANANARAKGCFGKSTAEQKNYKPLRFKKDFTVDNRQRKKNQ